MTPAALQRAAGAVRLEARAGPSLHGLWQSGCLRACLLRRHGGPLEAVIVNTAGGIADGDRLEIGAVAGPGADLVLTTPAAERLYRARPGAAPAAIAVSLTLGAGARLAYLPQETILFDGGALRRTLAIDMPADASFLGIEALVFGRAAHGETLATLDFADTIRLRRDGRLLLHDAVRLHGNVGDILRGPAGAGGRRGVATMIYAAPDAPARLDPLRAALAGVPAEAGASVRDGILIARLVAPDAPGLRAAVMAALAVLRPEAALPRVWSS